MDYVSPPCVLVSVRLAAVEQLSVETVSEGSVRVRWRAAGGVRAYRLVWGPFTGQNEGHTEQHFLFAVMSMNILIYTSYLCLSPFSQGRNVETVEVAGDREFYTLSRLQADTEYIVTIIPLYERNIEGPVASARFKIGSCAFTFSTEFGPIFIQKNVCCVLQFIRPSKAFLFMPLPLAPTSL